MTISAGSGQDELSEYLELDQLLRAQIDSRSPWSSDYNLKLERVTALLDALGNPQCRYPTIHVGGTSGKGTVAAMTAALLSGHGRRTGLHVSPYVQTLTESWQIDGHYVPPTLALACTREVVAAQLPTDVRQTFGPPSYFEVKVAVAFHLFAQQQVDSAVIEVGLGGRLDATNVLAGGIKVLTGIGLDHTEILGETIEEIARDKVEIVKQDSLVISGASQETVKEIVRAKARETSSAFHAIDDLVLEATPGTLRLRIKGETLNLAVPLRWPPYQLRNAAIAVVAAHYALGSIDAKASSIALQSVKLPGRFEVIDENRRTVVLDGAHNPDKIDASFARLGSEFPDRDIVVLLALKEGKDCRAIVEQVVHRTKCAVLTCFDAPPWKPIDPQALAKELRDAGFDGIIEIEHAPDEGLRSALELASPGDVVFVVGSLYLVGNVRPRWHSLADEIASGRSY